MKKALVRVLATIGASVLLSLTISLVAGTVLRHHVKDGTRYPSLLLLTADSDDRVDPMHARKFGALLQHASAGGSVLVRVEANSGHGGADKVKSLVEERADTYAFAWSEIGKSP